MCIFILYGPFPNYFVASLAERVLVQILTYENEFDLYEHDTAGKTHFYLKWFSKRTKISTGFDTEAKGNSGMAYCCYI